MLERLGGQRGGRGKLMLATIGRQLASTKDNTGLRQEIPTSKELTKGKGEV